MFFLCFCFFPEELKVNLIIILFSSCGKGNKIWLKNTLYIFLWYISKREVNSGNENRKSQQRTGKT